MANRRKFSAEFKAEVVLQVLTRVKSQAEMCREHQLNAQLFGAWKRQFLAAASRAFERDGERSAEQERIAELERMVGKLTMQLEIAKKPRRGGMEHRPETGGSHDVAADLSRYRDL